MKNSKKFKFWKIIPLDAIVKTNNDDKITIDFIKTAPLSFKKRRLEKNPSIFKFEKIKNKHNKIKNVWLKTSLSMIGKLYYGLMVSQWNEATVNKKYEE